MRSYERFEQDRHRGIGSFIPPVDHEARAAQAHQKKLERELASYGLDHARGKNALRELNAMNETQAPEQRMMAVPTSHTRLGMLEDLVPQEGMRPRPKGLPGWLSKAAGRTLPYTIS
jgi:hypothetical protein